MCFAELDNKIEMCLFKKSFVNQGCGFNMAEVKFY